MKNLKTTLALLLMLFISGFANAQSCNADATITPTSNPGEVQIIDNSTTSSGPAATYSWVDFYLASNWSYDGSVYLQPNTGSGTYQFTQNGTYNYYISVQDSLTNCFDSISGSITINNIVVNCDANFSYYDTLNNQTFFYPTNYNANLEYSWDFGDGNTSNNPFSYHTYNSPGTYTACLTVWDSLASCSDTICQTVTITNSNNSNCDASFYFLDTINGTTYFLPNNYDQNLSYFWDFGDGNTSNLAYPMHTYSSPGTYTACLTVYGNNGFGFCADTVCQQVVVTNNNVSCDANFYLFQDSVNSNIYYIWNLSAGSNLVYSWDFGDGTVSSQQFPTHTYTSQGIFTICLTVTDNNGNCSDQFCQTIEVLNKATGTTINVVPFGDMADIEDEVNIPTDVKLFPNPAMNSINISLESNATSDFNYQIIDVMGNQIDYGHLNSNQNGASKQINVSSFQRGVYFVRIIGMSSQEKVKTLKFIKK
jgi:PKD repeat protein